ncbi:MAG: acyltransferase family protein, partial [Bacteroidia bacterium]
MLSLKKINDPGRISSIDFFRSLAIIAVVIFHFNSCLPLGCIGVDMFFIISGVLIGGILTREFKQGKKINFVKFFMQRAFKILPSYYAFLIIGTLIALLLYHNTHSDQIIHYRDCLRYLFFYENYTGVPHHWSFSHLWSLCVEEHFYIFLPVLFIIIQMMPGNQLRILFICVIAIIILGIAFKFISFYYTNGHDTYSATHNRIDAFAWGV